MSLAAESIPVHVTSLENAADTGEFSYLRLISLIFFYPPNFDKGQFL